ncbi:MAG: type IX secretion system membrane protein PorP/SprF [Bacteroidetes bacterium]|nr:MAG: type IX secretion system membrane protein PorP/SprF [Bacteroidota bacterium]
MKKTTLLAIICLLWCASLLHAQDGHFSHYRFGKNWLNPATTAQGVDAGRLDLQYRSQWAAIPTAAYTTLAAGWQQRLAEFGWGLQLHSNHAGPASLRTTGILLQGAYHKRLGRKNDFLSYGGAIGLIQKRFNPMALAFESQYQPDQGFDPNADSGEAFQNTTMTLPDLSVGVHWTSDIGQEKPTLFQLGLAIRHFAQPTESFRGDVYNFPMRLSAYGSLGLFLSENFELTPHARYQRQGVHSEMVLGMDATFHFGDNSSLRLGAGARMGDALIWLAELKWDNKSIYVAYDDNYSLLKPVTGGAGAIEMGVSLRFGKERLQQRVDTDGDGIFDHLDACPEVPGLPELDGCPRPEAVAKKTDSDGDGIPDIDDRCPLEPGLLKWQGCVDSDADGLIDPDDRCPNLAGIAAFGGCPYKPNDADGDGVPDELDYCVYIKGSVATRGCPDTDGDGLSDIDDECPYFKGPKSNGGCPVASEKAAAAKGEATPPTFEPLKRVVVHFDTDKAVIKPHEYHLLYELAAWLRELDDYHIYIAGHTDAEGSGPYNQSLGMRRAEAVRDFLQQRGVPIEKMELVSYGETLPVDSNGTEEGKARNRRTEVVVLPFDPKAQPASTSPEPAPRTPGW